MRRVIIPERFYHVGGTMDANTPSYVQRQADQELVAHAAAGDFCYVLTPRQMGKSSLMRRTIVQLKKKRICSVLIDLQGKIEYGMTAETFYAGILDAFIRELKLPITLVQWWQEHALLSAVHRFSNFVRDEVLPRVQKRLVVFIDEIDSTLNLDFSDDFFAAIRAFYNDRAMHPAFKRLAFVLLGVASPSDLIRDRKRTPFNIGHRIELTDFTFEEARKLAEGFPLNEKAAERFLRQVYDWTGGHPYLTQKVCASLATTEPLHEDEQCVDNLINTLFFSDATWSDSNLAHVRDRIIEAKDNPDVLLELYRRILSGERVLDDERSPVHAALKLSGIVYVSPGGVLRPRNRIYERVFDLTWVDTVQRSWAGRRLPAKLDLGTWKAKVPECLRDWRRRMEQAGVDSVYVFLAAVTLGPVIQAAHAGEWAALMALGRVVAGVGDNRLAIHIQGWQSETDAAQQIAMHIAAEPALRAELDAVLDTLEVFPQARQALPEADHPWFIQTLRAELACQGNLPRFVAQFTGSGAIAMGQGAVAAGQGGVAVGGDVHGNIHLGSPARDPAAALAIYRRVLIESSRHMSLRGLDVGESDPIGKQRRLDLAQVYVDLHTTTQVPLPDAKKQRRKKREQPVERETRPLSVLEAVAGHRRMVLLGDPGSGKSTFLAYLALCLAAHGTDRQAGWLARLPGWPWQEADLVPIPVVLRDFARWLPEGTKKAEPAHLWNFIRTRLEAQNLAFTAAPLHDRLERGQAILLLDGLDEISTPRLRTLISDEVIACAERYPQCRIVVTCRTLSYQDPAWQLINFQNFTLAPFDTEQIDHFIAAWYAELARLGNIKPGAVEGATRPLREAVRRPDLWRLASNPLLLTVMALVHTHKGRLPDARALLYEETVDLLLLRWEQVKAGGEDDLPRLRHLLTQADRTDMDLKRALWQLAFEAHRQGGTADAEAVADIGKLRLQKTLVELHPDRSLDWAREVIEIMKLRAGLLLERAPEVYTFPHPTFQEYLAGAHLSAQPDFAQRAAQLVAEGVFWREVVLLAVGRLVYLNGDTARPLALVAELCPAQPTETDVAWRQAWLAGDVLLEIGYNRVRDSALGRELDERVRQRLVKLLRTGCLQPVERAAAGNTLARLGDPRFRVDAWYLPDDDLLGFVEIPAGPFRMGSNERCDSLVIGDEVPQHEVTLPRYYIARYPVTVAQFQAFVDESGYKLKNEDSLCRLPNHPVMNVTWYEALQYCEWLTERLREWEGTPEPLATLLRKEGWHVTLPSEAEWEKAARGTDGRIYPWGNDPDPSRANYRDAGIHMTSAVGCFLEGASPYEVEEMSGNISEWTRSLWGKEIEEPAFKYPYDPNDGREDLNASDRVSRVLRGGAFWDFRWKVCCATRNGDNPDYWGGGSGFRLVVLP